MPDLPLVSLLNVGQVSGVSGNSPPTQGAPGVPPALANLPAGTTVTGFILTRDDKGNPILRTERGDLLLKSDIFLKIGSEVSVRLEAIGGNIRARVVSIDGYSPTVYAQQANLAQATQNDNVFIQNRNVPGQLPFPTPAASNPAVVANLDVPEQPTYQLPDKIPVRGVLVMASPESTGVLRQLSSSIPVPTSALQEGAYISARLVASDMATLRSVAAANSGAMIHSTLPQSSSLSVQTQTGVFLQTGAPAPNGTVPPSSGNMQTPTSVPQQTANPTIATATPGAPQTTQTPLQSQGSTPFTKQTTVTSPTVQSAAAATVATANPGMPQTANPATATQLPNAPITAQAQLQTPSPLQSRPQLAPQAPLSTSPDVPLKMNTPAAHLPQTPVMQVAGNQMAPMSTNPLALSSTPSVPPGTVLATVVGTEKSGDVVLHTPLGTVKLPPVADLPIGSRVALELVNIQNPTAPTALGPTRNLPIPPSLSAVADIAHNWQTLSQVVSALATINPQAAQQIVQSAIPQVSKDMPAGIMFFLSALKGGDVRSWIGNKNVNLLEQAGHGELVKKLGSEFAVLRTTLEQPSQSWQMLFLPLAYGEELHQARLYIKRDREKDKKQDKKSGDNTRFVLEVELSELGNIQLDGLIRKKEDQTFFDLYMRSNKDLSPQIQHDIQTIFTSTAEMTGFKGTVVFQTTSDFPIKPLDEIIAEHARSIVV